MDFPRTVLSSAVIFPSPFLSHIFRSPGSSPYFAASDASAVPQVPSTLYPQKLPAGRPTRIRLNWERNVGDRKMSSLEAPRLSILFFRKEILNAEFHEKSLPLMMSELMVNSMPLFSNRP